jgi:hypothetical protein
MKRAALPVVDGDGCAIHSDMTEETMQVPIATRTGSNRELTFDPCAEADCPAASRDENAMP